MDKVKRIITVFDRSEENDFIVDEIVLNDVSLIELQELFSIPKENPMYDSYEITIKEKKFFEDRLRISFDFLKFIYFVDCYVEG